MALPSVDERAQFISWLAPQFGIDPSYALNVARHEGLQPNTWQSSVVKGGRREPSYGDYQLYMGGGLGNRAAKEWGYDPTNPENWKLNTAYGLMSARRGGWGPWYGARAAGITGFQGINRNAPMPADPRALAGGGPTGASAGTGNTSMPYDPLTASQGYGPVQLPTPSYQGGGGGGGQGAPATYTNPNPVNSIVDQLIRQMIASRSGPHGGRGGGLLGKALMMGLAGAASRVQGPAGGLVAGLASGLGNAMGQRRAMDLQDQMMQLKLRMLQAQQWEKEHPSPDYKPVGKEGYWETPPGGAPHFHGGQEVGAPASAPPQINPSQPIVKPDGSIEWPIITGTPAATPEATDKQQEAYNKARAEFVKNPRAAKYTAGIDIYNGMLQSAQTDDEQSDEALAAGLARLRNPLGTRYNPSTGGWDDDQSVQDQIAVLKKKWAGQGGRFSRKGRQAIMREAHILQENYRKGYAEVRKSYPKEALGGLSLDDVAPPADEPIAPPDPNSIAGTDFGTTTQAPNQPSQADIEAEIKRRGL